LTAVLLPPRWKFFSARGLTSVGDALRMIK